MRFKLLIIALFSLTITACYRIPSDEDFSVIPTTNNPAVTKEKAPLLPGASY